MLAAAATAGIGAFAEDQYKVEAGIAVSSIRGEQLFWPLDPNVISSSGPGAIPYIRVSYLPERFEPFSLDLGYYHVGTMRADVSLPAQASPDPIVPPVQFARIRDRITAWSIGPSASVPIAERMLASASVGGLWVRAAQRVTGLDPDTLAPTIDFQSRTQTGLRFHGRVALSYALRGSLDAIASYTYLDLDPSWNRSAHLFGLSLATRF